MENFNEIQSFYEPGLYEFYSCRFVYGAMNNANDKL